MLREKQNTIITLLCLGIVIAFLNSCKEKPASDLSKESLIPKPVSVTSSGEYFKLRPGTDIFLREDTEELKKTGQYLTEKLKISTGFNIDVRVTDTKPQSGCIVLITESDRTELMVLS